MKYLLPEYDINRFHKLDDLVRLCYYNPLNRKWGFPWNSLAQVGTTRDGLSESNIRYIESNSVPLVNTLNGVCFHGKEEFKIWLNPDLKDTLLLELTLLHELCHGYIGPMMHGKPWRTYFGMVTILYGYLINPDFTEAAWQTKHTIRRYRGEEKSRTESFPEYDSACDLELANVVNEVELNIKRITHDYTQLQEMREQCRKSTSATTPTTAYLAYQLKKVGMGSL